MRTDSTRIAPEAMEEAKAISHNPETKSYGSFAEALEGIDI